MKKIFMALALAGCGGGSSKPTADGSAANPTIGTAAALMSIGNLRAGATVSATDAPFTVASPSASDMELIHEVVKRTNQLREEQGLPPVRYDADLAAYAQVRAQEIPEHFAHERPDGSSVGNFGENIAYGQNTPQLVVQQWQNSVGHYRNMVDPNVETIGVGYYVDRGGRKHWVQLFGASWGDRSPYRFSDKLLSGYTPTVANIENSLASAFTIDGQGLKLNRTSVPLSHNQRLQLEAPGDHGWQWQTVGIVRDSREQPLGYLNLGQPFVPAETAALSGTYQGKAWGQWQGQESQSDVRGQVNFGAGDKVLDLQLSNSQRAGQAATELDFTDKLRWNSANQRFEGSEGNSARFYGPVGQELGGQFNRNLHNDSYQGVYGAGKIN